MHDAPPAAEPGPTADGGHPRPAGFLTPERIDAILADFRGYLEGLQSPPPAPDTAPPLVDVATVVAQFTALRHDVNLQTKATRAATEQAAAVVQQLTSSPKPPAADASAPLVKALVDIADALAASHRQIAGVQAGLEPLLAKLAAPVTLTSPPGFFGRLFGQAPATDQRTSTAAEAAGKLSPLLTGVADGYTMSLRRVEKALEAAGMQTIPAVGRAFDPDLMEVVEVAGGGPSGTVVEEVRRGYTRHGSVVRFALVKVAR
jgi:hypothetical protein